MGFVSDAILPFSIVITFPQCGGGDRSCVQTAPRLGLEYLIMRRTCPNYCSPQQHASGPSHARCVERFVAAGDS